MGRKDVAAEGLERLREFGLRYPGAHTKSPWPGHLDLAVRDKTFAYLSVAGEPVKVSCKLPRSAELALSFPFATPTEYGLGKSGWVTARFPDGAPLPEELLQQWIDESYRAQAPKRLSAAAPPLAAVEVSASTTAADGGAKVARARAKVTGARAKVPARAAASAKGRTAPARPTAKRAAKPRSKAPAAKRAAAPSRPSAPAAKRKKAAQRRPRASG